jgi:hypothetical protein
MKLIISNNRVSATLKDEYEGPHEWVFAPSDFDESRAFEYTVDDAGNFSLPAPPTIVEVLEQAVQKRLDDFAKTKGYENINSATTYISSSVTKYKNEGTYAATARDSTWSALYQIIDDATDGRREKIVNFSEIESELPSLAWPT